MGNTAQYQVILIDDGYRNILPARHEAWDSLKDARQVFDNYVMSGKCRKILLVDREHRKIISQAQSIL